MKALLKVLPPMSQVPAATAAPPPCGTAATVCGVLQTARPGTRVQPPADLDTAAAGRCRGSVRRGSGAAAARGSGNGTHRQTTAGASPLRTYGRKAGPPTGEAHAATFIGQPARSPRPGTACPTTTSPARRLAAAMRRRAPVFSGISASLDPVRGRGIQRPHLKTSWGNGSRCCKKVKERSFAIKTRLTGPRIAAVCASPKKSAPSDAGPAARMRCGAP
mmetsp:Transcript_148926/g.260208  ORF Transcript_148926/g.260208 Transcript_148926/m.260208 type:complete len:219 (-) Transcript_148926:617-1273(-)